MKDDEKIPSGSVHEVPFENLEALGRFASRLGHDFNNILASIQGCKEIMQMRLDAAFPNGNPCERQLKLIEASIRRGSEITTKIRGFLRPGPIAVEAIALKPTVEAVIEIISQSGITKQDIEVVARAEPFVHANEFLVSQVLTGLCLNSLDAMSNQKDRTLIIIVDTEEVPEPGHDELAPGTYACISVIDHGKGMSSEVKRRVFEPFFSTKSGRIGDGFGLNLAMADGILRRHKGALRLVSEKNLGTVAHVYLPVAPAPEIQPGS